MDAEQAVQSVWAGGEQLTGMQAPTFDAAVVAFMLVHVWPFGQDEPSQQVEAQTPESVHI